MSNSNAVMINVSEDIIKAHVQAAVQQVLNRDPERLVKAVVDAAMSQKRHGYSNEKTIWEEQLNEAIRDVAQETFREWIESVKPTVAKMVRERFEGPQGQGDYQDHRRQDDRRARELRGPRGAAAGLTQQSTRRRR